MIGALIGGWIGWRSRWAGLAAIVALIAIFAAIAPGPVNRAAPVSSVPADMCADNGSIESVTLVDDVYKHVYTVRCSNGLELTMAR